MDKQLLKSAQTVLKQLEDAGYAAFLVGGYIRDSLLNRPVKDIDIATSAKPEEVLALFPKVVPTGLKHGTVTVLTGGFSFEVTTFRTESEYEEHRRPSEVIFVNDIVADLTRRDFTINAMAQDRQGKLIDPFGGQQDLSAGILRCVGDAELRFREDALRLLRCVRFAAEYRLQIEPDTWLALHANARLLKHIAMERVRAELVRIVGGRHPQDGFRLLADSRLLRFTKVKLHGGFADWTPADLPERLNRLTELPQELRWLLVAKLSNLTAEEAEREWRQLTFSQAEIKQVTAFLSFDRYLLTPRPDEKLPLAYTFKTGVLYYGKEAAEAWLTIMAIYATDAEAEAGNDDQTGTAQAYQQLNTAGNHLVHNALSAGCAWIGEMPVLTVPELNISGQDVQAALKRPAGPWLGRILRTLLRETACGDLANTKPVLLERAAVLADQEPVQ
jgi:tRNA nucleotidyltransferase (CCA-adding enzyme)